MGADDPATTAPHVGEDRFLDGEGTGETVQTGHDDAVSVAVLDGLDGRGQAVAVEGVGGAGHALVAEHLDHPVAVGLGPGGEGLGLDLEAVAVDLGVGGDPDVGDQAELGTVVLHGPF